MAHQANVANACEIYVHAACIKMRIPDIAKCMYELQRHFMPRHATDDLINGSLPSAHSALGLPSTPSLAVGLTLHSEPTPRRAAKRVAASMAQTQKSETWARDVQAQWCVKAYPILGHESNHQKYQGIWKYRDSVIQHAVANQPESN